MQNEKLIESLRKKLKAEGRMLKWFILNYVSHRKYSTVMAQMCFNNPLSEDVADAIKKYLGEK